MFHFIVKTFIFIYIYIYFFTFIICGFPIIHSDPTYLPIPCSCNLPQNKAKFKRKPNKTKTKKGESCHGNCSVAI